MFKKLLSIVPVAAILTVGATAHASTITVQQGDTLWSLAQANHTSVETIQTANHLTTDLIHPGDLLTIAQETKYIVKDGDTLWDIAIKHHVSVSQIKGWNHLSSDLIHPGLNLVIYEGAKAGNSTAPQATSKSTNHAESTKTTTEVAAASTEQASTNETASENTREETVPASSHDTTKESAPETAAPASTDTSAKQLTVQATAYTASCAGCTGITSTGINLKENPDVKVISVDPSVIPLGSKVYVEGYGEAVAGDTGSGIKGNKIDVYMSSKEDAIRFGVKQLKVTILN